MNFLSVGSTIQGKMSSGEGSFVPKEELVSVVMSMGYSRNQACRALFRTGNCSADLAVSWILDSPEGLTDKPLGADETASDSDEDPTAEGFLETSDFYKMVFVVNTDLGMGVGKLAAQVGHAAIGLYKELLHEQHKHGEMLLQWEQFGETKIVLKGNGQAHLMELATKAASLHLKHYLVQDAGKTQIAEGSMTVLGIMGRNDAVDAVTGELGLL